MIRHEKIEVLVVGAGPVGMLTALRLAQAGIEVKIIDQESAAAARSYSCCLHSSTLKLLEPIGLAADVLKLGRQLDTMGFHHGSTREAQLEFSALPSGFPLVVLPQSDLEKLLEQKLNQTGLRIDWNHRLAGLVSERGAATATATVDHLEETSLGYSVQHWEWAVRNTIEIEASFVVGADGPNSLVRRCLGIARERVRAPELFVVYEFESDQDSGNDLRVVLDGNTVNVLWPLPGRQWRWSFQWVPPDEGNDFPGKDREAVWLHSEGEEQTRRRLNDLIRARAPWFSADVGELDWAMDVQFQTRLARQFGQDRCWLAGDAAHQTGPVGAQSMNGGLREAGELAAKIQRILRENDSPVLFRNYESNCRREWRRLLGMTGAVRPKRHATPWVTEHAPRLLSCLPASGEDLTHLLQQLGLELI